MATAEVLSGYDSIIYLATEQAKQATSTLVDGGTINIDNTENDTSYPKITITAPSNNITVNSISDGVNTVSLGGISVSTTDTLVLDFNEQAYALTGATIITSMIFDDNSLLEFRKGENTTLTFDIVGEANIVIDYDGYSTEEEISYVESFSITYKQGYSKRKRYNDNKIISTSSEGIVYNISISKLTVGEKYTQDIFDNKKFKIKFDEDNNITSDSMSHILLGVQFENHNYGFTKADDLMMTDLKGFARNLIYNKN